MAVTANIDSREFLIDNLLQVDIGEDVICSICLGNMVEGDSACEVPVCLHKFHIDCLADWILLHYTCPYCRTHVDIPEMLRDI